MRARIALMPIKILTYVLFQQFTPIQLVGIQVIGWKEVTGRIVVPVASVRANK